MPDTVDKMEQEFKRLTEKSSGKGSQSKSYAYEEVKILPNTYTVVRILDGSTSYKKYFVSWICCDDDVIRSFIIENDDEGKGILARMLGDPSRYFAGGYLESRRGSSGGKFFVHRAKDPELFDRMYNYYNPTFGGFSSCRPRVEYVYNVIHRNPTIDELTQQMVNWCEANRHTKLIRFGARMFTQLKILRDNYGDFDAYDIVISKMGSGPNTQYTIIKADVSTVYNKIGPVTPEEMSYDRYDLSEVSRLSSAYYILMHLRTTIERIDKVMGTHYLSELEQQLSIEKSKYSEHEMPKMAQASDEYEPLSSPQEPSINAIPNIARSAAPSPMFQQSSRVPMSPSTPRPLTPSVENRQASPSSQVALLDCPFCQSKVPENLTRCPKCGSTLIQTCGVCGKPMSIFASVCSHCGQSFVEPSR